MSSAHSGNAGTLERLLRKKTFTQQKLQIKTTNTKIFFTLFFSIYIMMIKCTHILIMMTKGDFKKKEIAAMTVYVTPTNHRKKS